eukprot:TRINITY_DN67787_c3_g3_i1.p2 TRINITY_DN67787_c3_g3~~TRINITY_DN67787_c3_g3_i1.p2  ORF type:complete len:213 (-),score=18.65 TRINITY_DN67787_c3_g3_i1:870-1508(-)
MPPSPFISPTYNVIDDLYSTNTTEPILFSSNTYTSAPLSGKLRSYSPPQITEYRSTVPPSSTASSLRSSSPPLHAAGLHSYSQPQYNTGAYDTYIGANNTIGVDDMALASTDDSKHTLTSPTRLSALLGTISPLPSQLCWPMYPPSTVPLIDVQSDSSSEAQMSSSLSSAIHQQEPTPPASSASSLSSALLSTLSATSMVGLAEFLLHDDPL